MAGKRAGLAGDRSGLFFEFVRIIREMREASDGRFPKYVLIENVPGLLSSDRGRDFGIVLNELAQCGAVDIAWRIIDSQHWVPQRRRRVFIVACFAPIAEPDSPIGTSGQILSLSEGCGGHPQARGAAGQDAAAAAGSGIAKSLRARANASHREDSDTYIPTVSPALAARDYKSTREDIAEPAFIAHSLTADGFDASEDGTGRGTPLVASMIGLGSDPLHSKEIAQPQTQRNGDPGVVQRGASVRRLTPTECERLMGLPDGWTDVGGMADGPRYRMCGNAVVVPVIEWIGRRIIEAAR